MRRILSKYDLNQMEVDIASGWTLNMVGVTDPYDLLDQMIEQDRLHRDERFPYWAEVWPASLGLSRWFCRGDFEPPSLRAVELGCGLGLLGITLARLGWRIKATDFVEDALVFTSFNARNNQVGGRHQVGYLDWRHPVGNPSDCLVAADVVYEKKNHPYLERVLRQLLLPGGRFYLSDPQRSSARPFCEALEEQGYEHLVESHPTCWKALEHKIDIHTFTKPE